jgi:hypothetical protein
MLNKHNSWHVIITRKSDCYGVAKDYKEIQGNHRHLDGFRSVIVILRRREVEL